MIRVLRRDEATLAAIRARLVAAGVCRTVAEESRAG